MTPPRRKPLLAGLFSLILGIFACLTSAKDLEAQQSLSAKQALQRRKVRVSARYDLIGPNETLIGVKLPPPWNIITPQPSTSQFVASQEAAWEILARALFPDGIPNYPSTRHIIPYRGSIESFQSLPNIFRLHNLKLEAIPSLRQNPNILFVSNDPGVVTIEAPRNPNTVINPKQLTLDNPGYVSFTDLTGKSQRSRWDIDIDAIAAWRWGVGSSDVVVAVVDDSFDLTKPEFRDSIYTNPGEIPCNGIDDDNNGYVDDANRYDLVQKRCASRRVALEQLTAHRWLSPSPHPSAALQKIRLWESRRAFGFYRYGWESTTSSSTTPTATSRR